MKTYRAGIDVGSTTVKLVILDDDGRILFGEYMRHMAHTQETLATLLKKARERLGDCSLNIRITGSGSINLGKSLGIEFVQEVVAVATALKSTVPQTDVAIELGGEDAKIIYFTGGLEERMNGVCAGGTGSFIDQMASLLQTDAMGLNNEAKDYTEIYPIAARCGVFAKSDIQPLINEGATRANLAASIFQAVVNQTISGLACGKPIRGCVAFLGGPLHFLPELKKAFIRTLHLTDDKIADPENSHLFAAMGSALEAGHVALSDISTDSSEYPTITDLIDRLEEGVEMTFEIKRLPSLFANDTEYSEFKKRHSRACVAKADLSTYSGNCFLGIDAGSTTTKLAIIGEHGELLYSFYSNNNGSPIKTAIGAIKAIKALLPASAHIVRSCSTGYGEALLKSAFCLDEGEVETIAHCTAAEFFVPGVECVLDIGGQDMKCIKLKNHTVDSILLNEACSSGCGSFIENFANSLGYSAADFAQKALYAKNPVDLGTRCTVFMNSNVKQAQKEGASVSDISAGLAYSVIKNALFKVIKLSDAASLGSKIVVQGGTFYNEAVLRAFEKISGAEATCPDISGIMGAFGAALIARERYHGEPGSMLSLDEIANLTYTTSTIHCNGCSNHCMLTVNKFPGNRRFITGNRCEKGLKSETSIQKGENIYAYKLKRIFDYEPLSEDKAFRGTIGIPRVLNIYENYPYWAVFFKELGYRVVLSPLSDRHIYELGMESIPSESECYPAKLAHGHVQWLINNGVKRIFHPCVFYEKQETPGAQNRYNCPMVVSYPENLKNNIEEITVGEVEYIRPFIAFTSEKTASDRLVKLFTDDFKIPAAEVKRAAKMAWAEQRSVKNDIQNEGRRILSEMEKAGGRGIVLAGRPYHIDPEINHGIPEMIASYGLNVLSEDSVPVDFVPSRPVRVVDQWVFHSRLYTAAEFVQKRDDLELIQLNSFGCGLDAVTTDQVMEILENGNKLYTLLKIDEVSNLGAARIRIRSLIAAMNMRRDRNITCKPAPVEYKHSEYTKEMFKEGYTILAPQMSPIHFNILEPVFRKYGYNFEILDNDNRTAIDYGLKFVNNDACYPTICTVGQFMEAVLSGRYDTHRLAIVMTQTGGCCRASNYVSIIRRALDKVNMSYIPVISLNANGMETCPGLTITPKMLLDAAHALVYGDLIMRCLYRVRPYEKVPGSANALRDKWTRIGIDEISNPKSKYTYKQVCAELVKDFDVLPINEEIKKPRVAIVGEILVKYMPLANNHLVDLLEREGAEVVVPDLTDFINYCLYGNDYTHEFLGTSLKTKLLSNAAIDAIEFIRKPAAVALNASSRFTAPIRIEKIGEMAKPILSLGNQYGEGWFLTGEMVELLTHGVPNIVCIQPFACLPNHVVGKGAIKQLRRICPEANIAAVDYDPGASEVNQLNRIKLMLSVARDNLEKF